MLHGSHGSGVATHYAALVSGYHVAFAAAAVMLFMGALLLTILLRRRHLESLEIEPSALPVAA